MPESVRVVNIDFSVIKADLPGITTDWSKFFVQIQVDGGQNAVHTHSTKKAGKHEWDERFSLPARSGSILRFELKQKAFFHQKSLAFAESPISDLITSGEKCGGDTDLPIPLRPCFNSQKVNGDKWRLLVRFHTMGDLVELVEPHDQRQVSSVESCIAEIVLKLEAFMVVGDAVAQLNPYALIAWKAVTCFYTLAKAEVERNARLEDLAELMKDAYAFVDDIKSFPEKIPALETTIGKLLSQTVECTMFLRECSGRGFGGKLASGAWMDRQLNGFTQSFTALKQSLETGTVLQVALVCFRLDDSVNRLLYSQALLKLGPADMDDATRSECLPNTRMDILGDIFAWVSMPTVKRNVYWLHGFPGAGKSTITTSVANIFRDLRRLGAFTFFTRGMACRNDPSVLIRTLAFQLGEFDHRLGSAIARVIEEIPTVRQAPLRYQFQKLLVEPLTSTGDFLREGPVLLVIDALDECQQSNAREELLKVLASETIRLPPTLRILITSRAERDIQSACGTCPHVVDHEIDIKSPTNEKDVRTFIHHRMVDIRLQNEWLDLPSDWPGEARTDALALRASGLFIWASTACRYIAEGQDPEERLSQLVRSALYTDAEAALDGIYITALESASRWDDAAFATDFREIMGLVIVAENPLTAHTIDLLNASMGGRKHRPCLHTIRHFGTVLQWAEDQPICVMHPSFADFITELRRCRSTAWFIDRPVHHLRVARLCIARLQGTLKKNICGLTLSTSGWKDELPEDVVYTARYWVDHLCCLGMDDAGVVVDDILDFLRLHFLHWIEVMTVMKKARQTIGLMIRLKEWIDSHYVDHEVLRAFAKDAVRFCQAYTHVYEQHPLLVYQGALPFTPTATTVFQTFKDDPELPVVVGGFRDHWSPLLIEFGRPGHSVIAISCSPDGRYIASTNTQYIFVWDSMSGELATKPMQASGPGFSAIVFSPDSQHLASGSNDGVVRLWDASSGEQVSSALEHHKGPVYGLVFSRDAHMLVSASKDQTIVVWDTDDGSMVHAPLTGHRKSVLAVAFSPTEMRFASGSRDRTIRVWDAANGREVLAPIIHRGGGVTALVYTPDGDRLLSGSDDRTIRVWDAHSGALLFDPHALLQPHPLVLGGHNSDIFSLAVSPCGTLLASASKDTTVRLWDLSTYAELTHLVRQHRMSLRAVAFTPDSQRLVTAAQDATVRVWDVTSAGSMGAPRLHKGLVTHLAFSRDGRRLVSGGLDRTVRVWCTETGAALIEPLRLELDVVCVAFDEPHDGDGAGAEPGRVRILAADRDDAVFAWDMATRAPLQATPADHPAGYARTAGEQGPLVLEGRWIVDARTDTVLGMLPNMSPAKARAAFGDTIAIGLANGSIVLMRFPLVSVGKA